MDRTEMLRVLAKHRTDEIVVTTMTTTWMWPSITNNPDLDYPAYGVMAQGASIGLGIALGRPDRKVLVLNGDGSQLMHLGSIVSIANAGAKNLVLFVVQNDQYEMTGGQPIPMAGKIDFASAGKALGMKNGYRFDDPSEFDTELPHILREEGPTIVALRVSGPLGERRRPNMKQEVRRFREMMLKLA